MIWLFGRGGEKLKFEICRQDEGGGYLLVMTRPNGETRIEQVTQPTELIEKSVVRMRQLTQDGWKVG